MASMVFSGDVLTVLAGGKSYQIGTKDHRYESIKKLFARKASDAEFVKAFAAVEPKKPVVGVVLTKAARGPLQPVNHKKVEVRGDRVFFGGEEVHGAIVDRIRDLQAQGLPFDGMAQFLEKLYGGQVSYRVRQELLGFIKKNGLTINSDGMILAYKAVRSDYMDKHSGKFLNKPGCVPYMDRAEVDDDFDKGCSKGLHAGALVYVYSYGNGDDRIVIVAIDPADVVSVPKDCSCQKLRICKYTVVSDYNGELDKVAYDVNEGLYAVEDDEDEDEEDFGWLDAMDGNEDEELDDDVFDEGDVQVSYDPRYGVKPKDSTQAGRKFHNRRDASGKFA